MARTGGTIFKDKDGNVISEIAATLPAGTRAPTTLPPLAPSANADGAGGAAADDGGVPDQPSSAATHFETKKALSPRGSKKGNNK